MNSTLQIVFLAHLWVTLPTMLAVLAIFVLVRARAHAGLDLAVRRLVTLYIVAAVMYLVTQTAFVLHTFTNVLIWDQAFDVMRVFSGSITMICFISLAHYILHRGENASS